MLVSLNSKSPIFEQIISQLINLIDTGVLQSEEKLPSVRELAIDLGVNPNTVSRAYTNLEEKGYIYSLNKKGYFIKGKKEIDLLIVKENLKFALKNANVQGLNVDQIRNICDEFIKGER